MRNRKAHREARKRVAEVRACARVLERDGRFGLTRGFIQHGNVSVYAHVLSVALASLAIADALARLGIRVDRPSLTRGALLHDYFLYDWHVPIPATSGMGSPTRSRRSGTPRRISTSPRARRTSSSIICSRSFPFRPPASRAGS